MPFTPEEEKKAWMEWKNSPGLETNKKLFEIARPRIDFALHKYQRSGLPPAVLETEAKKLVLYQAKSFDPDKEVAFSTHVSQGLRKLTDYVEDSRNIVRIPGYLRQQVPNYISARDHLWDNLGRPPTATEVADKLRIGVPLASKLENLINMKEIGETGSQMTGFSSITDKKEEDVIRSYYFDLPTNEERLIYEYTFGLHGKPKKKPKEISELVGWQEQKVRKFQHNVGQKLKDFVGR